MKTKKKKKKREGKEAMKKDHVRRREETYRGLLPRR
jgi:hypothetical protein